MMKLLILFAILAILTLTSCSDPRYDCEEDDDCGYSCTYGCVASDWYGGRQETEECSKAQHCACIGERCTPGD